MPANNADYSKELYKDSSNKLTKTYIAMIVIVLAFFIVVLIPYFDVLYKSEKLESDSVIGNITELYRLLTEQEKISKTIQNNFDVPTLAAINDYEKLHGYFRNLELIYSKAIASSSNVSTSQLDIIVPTFLKCNQDLRHIDRWMSCSAKTFADGLNKKIMLRYQNIGEKIVPLQEKANNNSRNFKKISSSLIEKNDEIAPKLPKDIRPETWEEIIDNSTGRMSTWALNINNTLDFYFLNKSAIPWYILKNPSRLNLTYSNNDRLAFKTILYSLNQSKSHIVKEMTGLSSKFEEFAYPIVGKIPLAFTTAVIVYPAGVGVGSLICSYYLGQAISKRSHLHRTLKKDFDKELYPLWVEPQKVEPKTSNFIRYIRLFLFVSLPLIILIITNIFMHYIRIEVQSIFGTSLASIMTTSCAIGYILIIIGIIMVEMKLRKYDMPKPPEKDPYDPGYFC